MYFFSDLFAVLACLVMSLRFYALMRMARHQVILTRKAMVRVGAWIIALFLVLGFFIGADTINLLFHLQLHAGQFRNFGVGATVLIVGQGLLRDLRTIFAAIERPAAVPVPPTVPVEYPPIPPMPTRGTTEEFARYANQPAPPMPVKETGEKEKPGGA